MAKACQECVYTVAPALAPEEVSERKRRARGPLPQMTLPEDLEQTQAPKTMEDLEKGEEKGKSTIIRMEAMRKSKSKRKSITFEGKEPVSMIYQSESCKEVLVPVVRNQGNEQGGEQKE